MDTDTTSDTTSDTEAAVLTDDEAEVIWFNGELHIVRVPGNRTGGQFSMIEHHNHRGSAAPWHRHLYDDETFHILEGNVAVWCGDPSRPAAHAGPGDSVFLPRHVPHTYRVDSPTARMLTVHTPAGAERFFREGGQPAPTRTLPPAGPPDITRMSAAADKYGYEILGPPPELGEDRIM